MTFSDKKVAWGLSILSVFLLVNTFLKQYSESKISEYQNELIMLQNDLNAELERVQYYMVNANQDESLSLLLLINKDLEISSNISPITDTTGNKQIDSIDKRKAELRQQLIEHQITPSYYYGQKLAVECKMNLDR